MYVIGKYPYGTHKKLISTDYFASVRELVLTISDEY